MKTSVVVDAPVDRAWALLATYSEWTRWGVSITSVDVDEAEVRRGARGRVRTRLGVWLPFEITDVREGRSWAWRVAGIDATGHEVEELASNRTRVTFSAPWWAVPYSLVLRASLRRLARICHTTPPN